MGDPSGIQEQVLSELKFSARYVVVTPVRDEEKFLGRTIASMRAQTLPAHAWVIVDDGSKDRTGEIAEAAAREVPWIQVVRRSDRGFRAAGGGVVDAFYAGFERLVGMDWDFVVKLDGDLDFES